MKTRRPISLVLFWSAMAVVLLVVVAAVALTNTTLRKVEKDLPNTLLAQLYDLELIVEHLAEVVAVAELTRTRPGSGSFTRLMQKVHLVEDEVAALRETYVVDNLVQASAFYAIVAPAITDAHLWLTEGVSGFGPRSATTLEVVYGRIYAAYQKARSRQRASQVSARRILDEQVQRLNRFLTSVNLLFFATLAITLLMVALLVRQHVLQRREQQAHEDRRRAERRFQHLEAQYHQAQKMEAVGRLAGGLAHDLNNLLAPIIGYGELMLYDMTEDDPRRRPVESIHLAGTKARDLVAQLLAFSRKQALEVKPVDLSRVVRDFQPLLRRTIREDVDIRLELADAPPLIRADARQMEQVLVNLAVNAQDAMPDGGTLFIETSVVALEAGHPALVEDGTPGGHVMLAVRDTGCGMDTEVQGHIFEPFFTTKERGKGTGLGLSTVFGIVRQHGGRLQVTSRAGGGSVFRCYFPCADADLPAEAPPVETPLETRGSERVLVVEDNDEVRQLAVRVLEQKGYTVMAAGGGNDCLRLLDADPGPIDLVLTDVVMPDINGKALFEQVARRVPGVRVLYMSGYTDDAIVHHGVLEAGVAFIQKPFATEALAAKVRMVLDA